MEQKAQASARRSGRPSSPPSSVGPAVSAPAATTPAGEDGGLGPAIVHTPWPDPPKRPVQLEPEPTEPSTPVEHVTTVVTGHEPVRDPVLTSEISLESPVSEPEKRSERLTPKQRWIRAIGWE